MVQSITTERLNSVGKVNGGKRPGAGRPKGKLSPQTYDKIRVLEQYKQKVMKVADKLFKSQLHLADGISYLYKITTFKNGSKSRPELITDQLTIEAYLTGDLENEKDEYYYITTEPPDNRAIDSMLDRTFGKATQVVEGSGDRGQHVIEIVNAQNYKL